MASLARASGRSSSGRGASSASPVPNAGLPVTRPKSASVSLGDYDDPASIARFGRIARSVRSKSEDDLGFSVVDVTERSLSLLTGQLRLFAETALGRNAAKGGVSLMKVPHRLFEDYEPDGALEVMLSTCLRFKSSNVLRRLDFQNTDKRPLYMNLLRLVETKLVHAELLPQVKIFFNSVLSEDICTELQDILADRADVVSSPDEATHIIYPDPEGTTPAETNGTDYCRTLQLAPPLAQVHWWYHPDSYDSWIPIADVQGDPEPEHQNKGPWHVQARWVHDTRIFNEWMNELDYEIVEELRETIGKVAGGSERASKKKKSSGVHSRVPASPAEESGKKSKKRKRSESKADRSLATGDGPTNMDLDQNGSKSGHASGQGTNMEEYRNRSRMVDDSRNHSGEYSRTDGERERPRDKHRDRHRDRDRLGESNADVDWDADDRRKDRDRDRVRSRYREGRAGSVGDLKFLSSSRNRDGESEVGSKAKHSRGKGDSRGRSRDADVEGNADAGESGRSAGQSSKRVKTTHEDSKSKTNSDGRSLKVRINVGKRSESLESPPGLAKGKGDDSSGRPDLKVRVRMPTAPSGSKSTGVGNDGKVVELDKSKTNNEDDGRKGSSKNSHGDAEPHERGARRNKAKRKERRSGGSRNVGVSLVENADPIAESDIRRIRNISMDFSSSSGREKGSPSSKRLMVSSTSGEAFSRSHRSASVDMDGDEEMSLGPDAKSPGDGAGSTRATAVPEGALTGTASGAPVSAADLIESLPEATVRVPAQAVWFRFDGIHDLEKRSCSEFFSGRSSSKTPAVYKTYRDFMVDTWRQAPGKYMTSTSVRRHLAGDVCGILRVHAFLEHWGLINFGAEPESRPNHASVKGVRTEAWNATPIVEQPSHSGAAGASNGGGIPRLLLFDDVPPGRKSMPPSTLDGVASASAYKSKTEVPLATRREIYASAAALEYTCDACDGQYPSMLSARDFEQLTTVASSDAYDGSVWSETEVLLLLEGLERFGDDWNLVASHVGSKNNEQCVMQFLRMPIEDSFLGDQIGKWGRGGDSDSAADCVASGKHAFAGAPMPFADCANPVMAQVAFLASSVSTEVAAAAAQAALTKIMGDADPSVPKEDVQARSNLASSLINGGIAPGASAKGPESPSGANGITPNGTTAGTPSASAAVAKEEDTQTDMRDADPQGAEERSTPGNGVLPNKHEASGSDREQMHSSLIARTSHNPGRSPGQVPGTEIDSKAVQASAAVALAAAATRAKLLADTETHEIERMFGVVVETKLRVVEEKLKAFSALEGVVRSERDKLHRERERLYVERVGKKLTNALERTGGAPAELHGMEKKDTAVPGLLTANPETTANPRVEAQPAGSDPM